MDSRACRRRAAVSVDAAAADGGDGGRPQAAVAVHRAVPDGVTPYLDRFYFDVALSGARAPMAALTEMARSDHIMYGSDWPFVARDFVVEQIENLRTMPYFADDRFAAMERGNAARLFKRFADA
ncbi:MAG: amidohydrolase family protein [Rhizobiales bacterium]|nr:amidohydrolase family protein [Hyphomicrobiales bacterium]